MGYSNRMEWLRLNGLLNGDFYGVCADFYGLFTAFVPTFTDFYQVYRLLSSFLTLNVVFCYCLYLLNLLSFTIFYRYAP